MNHISSNSDIYKYLTHSSCSIFSCYVKVLEHIKKINKSAFLSIFKNDLLNLSNIVKLIINSCMKPNMMIRVTI